MVINCYDVAIYQPVDFLTLYSGGLAKSTGAPAFEQAALRARPVSPLRDRRAESAMDDTFLPTRERSRPRDLPYTLQTRTRRTWIVISRTR